LVGCFDLEEKNTGQKTTWTQPVCTLGSREEALDLAVLSINVQLAKEKEILW
jgi:hypothetical protein